MRVNLLFPGGLFTHDTYNKLFTMHGIIMVFFFLIPSIPAVLGNFLVPMMIGAKDLAFPRINLLSWYIYLVGAAFTLWAFAIYLPATNTQPDSQHLSDMRRSRIAVVILFSLAALSKETAIVEPAALIVLETSRLLRERRSPQARG